MPQGSGHGSVTGSKPNKKPTENPQGFFVGSGDTCLRQALSDTVNCRTGMVDSTPSALTAEGSRA